jgi:hypothetical protein
MDFREILGSSYKLKEPLREELQVNVDGIGKVLVMNGFLNNYSRTFFAEDVSILSIFMKHISNFDLNVNNIDEVRTNFFLDNISKWTSIFLLSS